MILAACRQHEPRHSSAVGRGRPRAKMPGRRATINMRVKRFANIKMRTRRSRSTAFPGGVLQCKSSLALGSVHHANAILGCFLDGVNGDEFDVSLRRMICSMSYE